MELIRGLLLTWIVMTVLLSPNSSNVEGRTHYHKNKKNKTPSPPQDPVSPPPTYPPTVPSDPSLRNSSYDCIFEVTTFGAVEDGSNDDTAAFREAWKAACAVENGVLLAPSDCTFMITSTIFSDPCKSGLVFQVDGVMMPNGPDCWPKEDSNKQWLMFYKLGGMTFTGSGTIEGNGQKWWELPCKPHWGPNGSTLPGPCDSPALIYFSMSYNGLLFS